MADIKAILEAKRLKALGVESPKAVDTNPVDVEVKVLEEKSMEPNVKKEEPAAAVPKALTFAEKLALKRAEEAAKTAQQSSALVVKSSEEKPVDSPASGASMIQQSTSPSPATTVVSSAQNQLSDAQREEILRTGVLDTRLDAHPPEVSEEVAQAASDIKGKIKLLCDMSGTDLENAMKELKIALNKNPSAVDLMEDTDIGQLVIALRKITGEAIAEAAKEKKAGRPAKNGSAKAIDLTNPDAVAALFNEL